MHTQSTLNQRQIKRYSFAQLWRKLAQQKERKRRNTDTLTRTHKRGYSYILQPAMNDHTHEQCTHTYHAFRAGIEHCHTLWTKAKTKQRNTNAKQFLFSFCVCVCVRAFVCVCVRACFCVCVCACVLCVVRIHCAKKEKLKRQTLIFHAKSFTHEEGGREGGREGG